MKRIFLAAASALLLLASCDAVNNADNPTNSAPPPQTSEPAPNPAAMQDAGMAGAVDSTAMMDTSRAGGDLTP